MATLNATNLKHASSGSNNIVLGSDGSTTISNLSGGVGKILQVVHTIKSNGFSVSASTDNFSDITGLSASITPASSSNKILINFQTSYSANAGQRGSFRSVSYTHLTLPTICSV